MAEISELSQFVIDLESGNDAFKDVSDEDLGKEIIDGTLVGNNKDGFRYEYNPCDICIEMQEDLLISTNFSCGQIVCNHDRSIDFRLDCTETMTQQEEPTQYGENEIIDLTTSQASPVQRQQTLEEFLKKQSKSPMKTLDITETPSPGTLMRTPKRRLELVGTSLFPDLSTKYSSIKKARLSPLPPTPENALTNIMGITPITSSDFTNLLSQGGIWQEILSEGLDEHIVTYDQCPATPTTTKLSNSIVTPVNKSHEDIPIQNVVPNVDLPSQSSPLKVTTTSKMSSITSTRGSEQEKNRLHQIWQSVRSNVNWNVKSFENVSGKTKCTSNKSALINYILDNNICNEDEYLDHLAGDTLCKLEHYAVPSQLRSIKDLAFAQVFAKRKLITYEDRIEDLEVPNDVKGPLLTWLESVARENNESVEDLVHRLFNVLCGRDSKKPNVIIIGLSDSGKSTFANILTAFYACSEIGYFSAPGQYTSTFWLAKLVGKSVYRGDEIVLENVEPMQKFKQLTEGCSNLETDVKYKGAQRIAVNPSITTCNGSSKNDFYKHMNHEADAISNRCEFFLMGRNLNRILPSDDTAK